MIIIGAAIIYGLARNVYAVIAARVLRQMSPRIQPDPNTGAHRFDLEYTAPHPAT